MIDRLMQESGELLERVGLRHHRAAELSLAPDATWSERCAAGTEIRCTGGAIWLTLEGDPEDHVLAAGDVHVVERRGRVAVMALGPARIAVARAAPRRTRAAPVMAAAPAPAPRAARRDPPRTCGSW
jgi:hypothetical protein